MVEHFYGNGHVQTGMNTPVNIAIATPSQNFCDHILADRAVSGHPFGRKSTCDEISHKDPEIRI